MPKNCNTCKFTILACLYSSFPSVFGQIWTPILVKEVTSLGPQYSPDVTNVSRDGGYSVLINGHILWLYDDTECMDLEGNQLSFVSNSAAYADRPNGNISSVADFSIAYVGKDASGRGRSAIVADSDVGTEGWIRYGADELDFNAEMTRNERVAICRVINFANNTSRKGIANINLLNQGLGHPQLHSAQHRHLSSHH